MDALAVEAAVVEKTYLGNRCSATPMLAQPAPMKEGLKRIRLIERILADSPRWRQAGAPPTTPRSFLLVNSKNISLPRGGSRGGRQLGVNSLQSAESV
jgi:hypothetical protein